MRRPEAAQLGAGLRNDAKLEDPFFLQRQFPATSPLQRLLHAAQDGILILDAEGQRITDPKPFIAELLRESYQEFVGSGACHSGLHEDQKTKAIPSKQAHENLLICGEEAPARGTKWLCHDVEFVSSLDAQAGRRTIQCNIHEVAKPKRSESELSIVEESCHATIQINNAQYSTPLFPLCSSGDSTRIMAIVATNESDVPTQDRFAATLLRILDHFHISGISIRHTIGS